MSRIRSRGNKETELALMAIFRAEGIRGWRRHVLLRLNRERLKTLNRAARSHDLTVSRFNDLTGIRVRPDFVFPKLRLAVFVDGCFWHSCPKHCNQPANNRLFWRRKLSGNKLRDRLVNRVLRKAGWRVLRIWEHELSRKNQPRCVARIRRVCVQSPKSEV